MNHAHIKKINPNDDLVTIQFTTAKGKGRGGGTTTQSILLPKLLTDMIKEK